MGRTLQVGERPGRRAKLAAPGKGQGALGHLFTKGQAGPMQGSSHRPLHTKIRQDAERGGHWPGNQGEQTSALPHTHMHSHTHSHKRTRTHAFTCAQAHARTATRASVHTVLSHICTHTCACMHTLILSYTQVLISRSWLQSWRFTPPPAKLHVSMKHFSRPPYNLPEPQAVCPTTSAWCPAKS